MLISHQKQPNCQTKLKKQAAPEPKQTAQDQSQAKESKAIK